MKKLSKIISVLALLFSLFAAFGSSMVEMAEADVPENITVTLHKKKMTGLPEPLIQNTGATMAEFAGYDDMPNVEFTVHDVTAQFYALRAGTPSLSVDAAMAAVAATPTPNLVGTGTTGADGRVSFTLPSKSGGLDAVYVFVETDAPSGTTTAANLTLVLPMFDSNDNIMTDILLYPKNVVAADGSLIVTKKGSGDGLAIANAEFIVSRELTTGNMEYLYGLNSNTGLYNWGTTRASAERFKTNSVGQFTITNLEHGNYRLHEVVAPMNTAIIGDGITPFTISGQTGVVLEITNDTIVINKELLGETVHNVGDRIPYSLTVNIPEGITDTIPGGGLKHGSLIITDAPDAGLQYNNDLAAANLTINPAWINTTGTNGFTLTIPAADLDTLAGESLTFTYNMYLTDAALADTGYNNLATVSTNVLTDNDETPDVFTGGFRFRKVDANAPTVFLDEAVFVVGRGTGSGIEYLMRTNNTVTWTTDMADATEFESGTDGIIAVAGLDYGDYWLRETKAPEGYVLPNGLVDFEIASGTFTEIDLLNIPNVRRGRLPSTGGSGILGIVGIGAALVATTGGYYIKRKREE